MENVIEIKNLTKDYGNGKGIFDFTFELRKGEILGFVGANGAGKTTTIRNIMAFLKPDNGKITIKGLDSHIYSKDVKKYIGYVPGEIAFPDLKSGTEFLKSQAEFLNLKNMDYANYIIEKLQLDITANLKRMSKGMKQKTAIVAALMNDAEILLLDEPTTGLDPLMRISFIELIEEEKKKGKSILISSHLYEELEKVCDRIILIDRGKIINITDMNEVRSRNTVDFKIEFKTKEDFERFKTLDYNIIRIQEEYNQVTIKIDKNKIKELLNSLTDFDLKFITEIKFTLEKHFNQIVKDYYKEEKND